MTESEIRKTVVIIGSAGRLGDAKQVCPENFEWMFKHIEEQLSEKLFLNLGASAQPVPLHIMSGGAAYVDHLAVRLKLKYSWIQLHLCLPAEWDSDRKQFVDSGVKDFRINPGGTSNYYHRQFSSKIGCNSLEELDSVIPSAIVQIETGFSARNTLLTGPVDLLLAYTFSSNPAKPGSNGTLSTWTKSKARHKIHTCIPPKFTS